MRGRDHALALAGGNARAIVFDLGERPPFRAPGNGFARSRPHRNAAPGRQVFEGVVNQVAERLAQQEHVAVHAGEG